MKYSPKFFRDSLPEWKRKKDPILSRVFYRPISFLFSSLFCSIGFTANMVSFTSVFVALAACICFVLNVPLAGAILVNIWLVLDCADGNIARSVKKEKFGDFADASSSYICVGLMFVCIGFNVYDTGGALFDPENPWIILMGAFAGSSDSLMRLLYQKYLNSAYIQGASLRTSEDPERESGVNKLRMKVDAQLSLGGILPIVVLLGAIFSFLDIAVIIWLTYYGSTFVVTALYLAMKVVKANSTLNEEPDPSTSN